MGSLLGEYGFIGAIIVFLLAAVLTADLGCRKLTKADLILVLILLAVLSLFRGVVSSYFYAMTFAFFILMLKDLREKNLGKCLTD